MSTENYNKTDYEENERKKRLLGEQFDHPKKIRINGSDIHIYDIHTENANSVPVLYGIGYSAVPGNYGQAIIDLAEKNRRVISIEAPHGVDTQPITEHPMVELRKAAAWLEMMEQNNIEKADAVAHSESAIYITIAATMHPEKFRNIILVDPAGIIGKDSAPRLMIGFAMDLIKEIIDDVRKSKDVLYSEYNPLHLINAEYLPARPQTSILELAQKVIAIDPLDSIKSFFAISNADILDMIKNLREKGVGVYIIHAADDKIFPTEDVQKMISGGQVDGFYSIAGTHQTLSINPRPTADVINYALNAGEVKYNKANLLK